MRPSRHLPLIVSILLLPLAISVSAAAGECNGFDDLSPDAPVAVAIVLVRRAYFVHTSLEDESCPSRMTACRQKAYVVKGDEVIVSREEKEFVCAAFIGSNERMALGWLPVDAVVRKPAVQTVRTEDWLGGWRFDLRSPRYRAQEFTIARGASPSRLHIEGNASYAENHAAARRGAVNVGNFSVDVSPVGASLAFAVGENEEALPHNHPGDEWTCRIRMRRLGRYLLANDKGRCGGMNVTFWGIYKRGKPSKP